MVSIFEFGEILKSIYQDPKVIKKLNFEQIEAVVDAFHQNQLQSKDSADLKNLVVTWLKNPDLQKMIQSKISDVVFKCGDKTTTVNDLILCSTSPYFESMLHGGFTSNISMSIDETTKKMITTVEIEKEEAFKQIEIIHDFMRKPKFSKEKIEAILEIFRCYQFNPRMFLGGLDNENLFNLAEYCSKNISKMEPEENPSPIYEVYSRVLNRILNKAIKNKLNIFYNWKFSKLPRGECYQVNLKDLSHVSKKHLEEFLAEYVCPAGSDVRQLSLYSLSPEIEELDLSKCHFEHLNCLKIWGALSLKVILPSDLKRAIEVDTKNHILEVFINGKKIPLG